MKRSKINKLINTMMTSCLSDDKTRPSISGFYFKEGLRIATNSYCMMVTDNGYHRNFEGMIITPQFQVIEEPFPDGYANYLSEGTDYKILDINTLARSVIRSTKKFKDEKLVYLTRNNTITANPPSLDDYLKTMDAYLIKKMMGLVDSEFTAEVSFDDKDDHHHRPAQFRFTFRELDGKTEHEATYIVMPFNCDLCTKFDKSKLDHINSKPA